MNNKNANERKHSGFTLIEIMAVVLIMGLLIGIVGYNVFTQVDRARVQTVRATISQLENALEFYRLDNGIYPTTEQGLQALVSKPTSSPEPLNWARDGYLRKRGQLLDPWGSPFQYESPGQHNANSFDLWSWGADRGTGGVDEGADIGNWDAGTPAGG